MRAARGEPEDHIARADRAPVDDAILLHHAEREAGEIVFVPGEGVRMLGRLAADQRAAGQLATRSDALDDLRRNAHVELFADVVVEEEQRLSTASENVVDAHRHEIDAHRVVPLPLEGELELGADAVGSRHEHRVTVFLRDLAQRAETADAGEHLGPQRAPGERLDRLDQRVAGLDVDAGVAVGKSFRHARVQILLDMPALASPQLWAWITIALAAGFLAWVLSPILAPFLFAAILAYIFDPLVERLTRHRVPRTLAVVLVLLLAVVVAVAIMLVVLPLFYKETRLLMEKLPGFVAWFSARRAPWLKARLDLDVRLDAENATQLGKQILSDNEQLAKHLLASLKTGGMVLITILADLVLVPVVLFYLLRDWNLLLDRAARSEEHTSELQSQFHLVCRLLLEKKKNKNELLKL